MLKLSGIEVSRTRRQSLKAEIEKFTQRQRRSPGLAVVLVGDNPASQVYVGNKIKACGEVGITSFDHKLEKSASEEEISALLKTLRNDPQVDGILVQLPLPSHLPTDSLLAEIDPEKDADGLTFENLGRVMAGQPRVLPCTPKGVMSILQHYQIPVAGRRAVVIGRSQIVGRPMAQLLVNADATVTICHSKTQNLSDIIRQADIAVVAAGQPRFLGKDAFQKGAVVVDVGIHRQANGKLCGDVRFEELDGWVSAATPVPGGVGPMTITSLLENTLILARMHTESAS